MKKQISTTGAPPPGATYSQGLIVGDTVYVSGTRPVDPKTGAIPESVGEQTRLVMENIKTILEAGGAGMNDVVKATVHLADVDHFKEFNEVYSRYFEPPYPVRTTVGSVLRGILVEIDVIAVKKKEL